MHRVAPQTGKASAEIAARDSTSNDHRSSQHSIEIEAFTGEAARAAPRAGISIDTLSALLGQLAARSRMTSKAL